MIASDSRNTHLTVKSALCTVQTLRCIVSCFHNQMKIQIPPEAIDPTFPIDGSANKAVADAENAEEQRTLMPRLHLFVGLIKRTSFTFNEYFCSTLVLLVFPVFGPSFPLFIILPPSPRLFSTRIPADPLNFFTACGFISAPDITLAWNINEYLNVVFHTPIIRLVTIQWYIFDRERNEVLVYFEIYLRNFIKTRLLLSEISWYYQHYDTIKRFCKGQYSEYLWTTFGIKRSSKLKN